MTGRKHFWDITPTVTPAMAVFPGDTPPTREVLMDMARGDHLTLSTLRTTVHLGAHVDAPSHYGLDAPSIEAADLSRYVGPCRVIALDTPKGSRIPASVIPGDLEDERVLFRTGTYPDPNHFSRDFAGVSVELVDGLAARGVRLVGIDTPSVDLATSEDLPAHAACLRGDVAILEGITLRDVPAGRYELIALPLKLDGFDGSPVRAVLRPLG